MSLASKTPDGIVVETQPKENVTFLISHLDRSDAVAKFNKVIGKSCTPILVVDHKVIGDLKGHILRCKLTKIEFQASHGLTSRVFLTRGFSPV